VKVPGNTSVNKVEFKPAPYVIPFAPELVGFILAHKKLTTYRFGKKYDYLKVGDTVSIQNSESKTIVCKAEITNKAHTTFKDIPIQTGTHESYRDKEHQREVQSGYYAYIGRPIEDNDTFLIIDFKLVPVTKAELDKA
jgi:hypothetical protein